VRYAGSPLSLAIVQGILTGAQDFGTAFQPQYQALEDDFILIDPAHRQGIAVVGPRKLVALPMIVQVMAQNPTLPSAQPVAQINASIEAAAAMKKLQATFLQLASHCGDTARVLEGSAWMGVAPAYAAARSQAKHDQTLAPAVSAIAAVLSHGPKADTAVQTAARTQQLALKAQARADKARARAAKALAAANALTTATPASAPASTPAASVRGA
jgi:hypothetical protein